MDRMRLSVYQSFWGMMGLPRGGREWTVAEKIARIAASGFDGVDVQWSPRQPSEEAIARANAAGLPWGVTCFPTGDDDFAGLIARLAAMDVPPRYVNIQPNRRVFTVAEGAPFLREWWAISTAAGFATAIETHRDRMTTDLRFTLRLLEAAPELRVCADLSHFVVGQEFAWPVGEEDHALIGRVLERAAIFHGRVATREQVQVPIAWEHHRPWLELFLGWWEQGFRDWRSRAAAGDELVFVTELGPPWYALTGADGGELSDRFDEALRLQRLVREIWERLEADSGH
jgi:hypothetical protein